MQMLKFWMACLQLGIPPLRLRGYSIAYDQANLVIDHIVRHRPKCVVELGSGTSTVIWSALVRKNFAGQLASVEGETGHMEVTRRLLDRLGLMGDKTRLLLAPYREYTHNGRNWRWYDADQLSQIHDSIDFLFIDGPPSSLHELSRYPALPLLWNQLSPNCVIILDDGDRESERTTVKLWLEEFSQLTAHYVPTVKGTWILERRQPDTYPEAPTEQS